MLVVSLNLNITLQISLMVPAFCLKKSEWDMIRGPPADLRPASRL